MFKYEPVTCLRVAGDVSHSQRKSMCRAIGAPSAKSLLCEGDQSKHPCALKGGPCTSPCQFVRSGSPDSAGQPATGDGGGHGRIKCKDKLKTKETHWPGICARE